MFTFKTLLIPLLLSVDKDDQSWDNSVNNWAIEILFVDGEVLLD